MIISSIYKTTGYTLQILINSHKFGNNVNKFVGLLESINVNHVDVTNLISKFSHNLQNKIVFEIWFWCLKILQQSSKFLTIYYHAILNAK